MAEFDVVFSDGSTLDEWTDPPSGAKPTRLNPVATRPHKRRVGFVASEVELSARLDGVVAPLDGALAGRLFGIDRVEHPVGGEPFFSSPPGQSSVQRFTPAVRGHYTVVMHREGSGRVFCHLDVTEVP